MRSPSLRLEHLRHQVHERAVGVELLRGVAAVVGELLDQVLVGVAQFVFGHCRQAEIVLREVLDEILQRLVGHLRLVGPRRVAEDAGETLRVGGFDRAERVHERASHIARGGAHVGPMRAFGNREPIVRSRAGVGGVCGLAQAPSDTPRPTRPRGA